MGGSPVLRHPHCPPAGGTCSAKVQGCAPVGGKVPKLELHVREYVCMRAYVVYECACASSVKRLPAAHCFTVTLFLRAAWEIMDAWFEYHISQAQALGHVSALHITLGAS